jgi:hypothetical protein
MSRDIERARDGLKATAPEGSGDAEPEPSTAGRPLAPARSNVPTIPVDPDLLRYRHRLDRQLIAWRNSRSATSLANALAIVSPTAVAASQMACAPALDRLDRRLWCRRIGRLVAGERAGRSNWRRPH